MNVFLFTDSFPYGKAEAFIENEIPILASKFDTVHVFPYKQEEGQRPIPDNCKVHSIPFGATRGIRGLLWKYFGTIIRMVVLDFLSTENRKAFKSISAYKNDLIRLLYEVNELNTYIETHQLNSPILYTYWFGQWTSMAAVMKQKHQTLLTRSHRYDYLIEGRAKRFFQFRPFTLSKLDLNLNVSEYGVNYLKTRYPKYQSKVKLSNLGVQKQADIRSFNPDLIVSCSSVIPHKRVEKVIDALMGTKEKLRWVHFGDGSHFQQLKEKAKALPPYVQYELKGAQSNSAILKFYKQESPGLFVHFSSSEGLPVSMMEAQSYGIPILACDIPGMSEIINEKTGELLPIEFDSGTGIEKINELRNWPLEKRKTIQDQQREKFSAQKNYQDFVENYLLTARH